MVFNFFKKLINPNDSDTNLQDHQQELINDAPEISDFSMISDSLVKKIRPSKSFTKLVSEFSKLELDNNAIENTLDEIKAFIPENYEVTLRVVRWDGRVMAQKGTVISPNIINLIFETSFGEFSLQIVLTPKPTLNEKYRILWLGLDYAGKTSLIHRLRYNEFRSQNRTIGQDIEDFIMEGIRITNIDLGGQESLRNHWTRFPIKPHVIVYVIDASDSERFQEALFELKDKILSKEQYKDIPILFLLNKMDLIDSPELEAFVVTQLNLPSVMDVRTWHVVKVSAKTGDGLYDAIQKLATLVQAQVTQ